MAGIFDTLAQVTTETKGFGADAEKTRRGAEAWARAQELKAAKMAAPTAPTGVAYGAGKAVGKAVGGRLVPALAIGDMGFGMADQAEATTAGATPENRPERALKILAGADVTGLGARIGRTLSGGDFFGATPGAPPSFGAVLAAASPITPAPVMATQADVRKSDNAIAANAPSQVADGAWAAPHGASPGIGAQLEAGPATPSVSSSRDANGNLVLTNAPPGPAAAGGARAVSPGTMPAFGAMATPAPVRDTYQNKAAGGSLASFFGASMNEKKLATEEARNTAAAEAQAARDMEAQKINATLAAATAKQAVSPKDAAEAARVGAILEAARGARTPEERNALLTGHAQGANAPYRFVPGMNPGEVFAGNAQTGDVTLQQAKPPAFTPKEGDRITVPNAKGERIPGTMRGGKFVPD